jgi:dipeptidyl aminopeptidase/acylaminoacyl peptidase
MTCGSTDTCCRHVEVDRLISQFALLCVVLVLAASSVAQSADAERVIAHSLATHHFSEVTISPDGKQVAWVEVSVHSENEYAHTVYLASTGRGARPISIAITDSPNQFGISWSPDSKELAFLAEKSSSEESQLRVVSADGTLTRSLASFRGQLNTTRWSPDGRTISLLYSESKPDAGANPRVVIVGKQYRQQRVALVDLASGRISLLTPSDLFIYEYDWSPDSRRLVVTAAPCCTEARGTGEDNWWTAELYRIDINSGRRASIFSPKLQIAMPKWSPDGRSIAFIGGLMSDFIAPGGDIFLIDAGGGNARDLTPGLKASVTWIAWTENNEILTTEIVDGEASINTVRTDSTSTQSLWQGADGPYTGGLVFALSIASDGRTSAAVRESFDRAPEIWVGTVGQWRQLSSVNKDQEVSWGNAKSVHWSSDGMQIQGWLLYPANYVSGKKYPMVVLVHGGPAAAALNHWPPAFDEVEVLSNLGYFVLYPNPRGSMGQGEDFTQRNVKDLGYGDLRDIQAGVKYAVENLFVDPQRIGITGWSYGGFMAMWAITQTDMFRASVAGPGVSNWQSYYGQVDIEKWLIPYFGASVYEDPAIYARSSPVNFVRNAQAATLLYVGNEDLVCPAAQSFELWRALKHRGVETELLFYSGEGHGISRPADQRDIGMRTVRWFSEHLK